jgi:tartrate dehydrogenase/decarboxylase/D-malate dehydrogenase
LGEEAAAADIMTAIEDVLTTGPKTPDMQGVASTQEVGAAIAGAIV